MVHEVIAEASNCLDYNLDKTKPITTVAATNQPINSLHNSCNNRSGETKATTSTATQSDHQSQTQSHLLPTTSSNLSWKFFDQVVTVDNQLRNEESSVPLPANDCLLMPPPALAKEVVKHPIIITSGSQEAAKEANICLSNGHSRSPKANDADDILSQSHISNGEFLVNTGDSITTFKFTSPTSTFKRKKQQQQQREQINNNYCNYSGQQPPQQQLQVPYDHHHRQQSPQSSKPQATENRSHVDRQREPSPPLPPPPLPSPPPPPQQQQQCNDQTTMIRTLDSSRVGTAAAPTTIASGINNGNGRGSGSTTGTGTGTIPRPVKTRTLPAITSSRKILTEGELDLVARGGRKEQSEVEQSSTSCGGVGVGGGASERRQQRLERHQKVRGGPTKMGATGGMGGPHTFIDGIEMHLGLMGWRKKCLYTLLVLLMLLIITNLVLTLWILKVMEFSTDGMGQLKIVPGGIQLTGQALITDMLKASTIRSRHGQPITLESSRNFSINTRDKNGMLENHLFLGHDKLECLSTEFRINGTDGKNLFSVNRNEVTIGAHALRIEGEGGAIFRESIQTPHVRAEPGRELRLESPTRQLEMTAARDINLQSRAGGIIFSGLEDVKLSAVDGSLRLESPSIMMPNLRTAQQPMPGTAQSRDHLHRVFQLCACANGKLFLAAAHSICAGDESSVCR